MENHPIDQINNKNRGVLLKLVGLIAMVLFFASWLKIESLFPSLNQINNAAEQYLLLAINQGWLLFAIIFVIMYFLGRQRGQKTNKTNRWIFIIIVGIFIAMILFTIVFWNWSFA